MSIGSMSTDNSEGRRVRETKETEYNTNHKSISPEKVKHFFFMFGSHFGAPIISDFWWPLCFKTSCCENPITFPQAPLATWRWGAAWQNVVTWRSSIHQTLSLWTFKQGLFGGFDWHQPKKLEKSFKVHMYMYIIYIELYLGSCQFSKHCSTGWRKLRLGFPS